MIKILNELRNNGLDYRIIEEKEDRVLLIIDKQEYLLIDNIMNNNNYEKKVHPFGKLSGYTFEYQLSEFLYYQGKKITFEIFFQLPCLSLTPYVWIPLEKTIQKAVWESFTLNFGKKYLSFNVKCIYIIAISLFRDKKFNVTNKEFLEKHIDILDNEKFKIMLKKILFSFTDILIQMIKEKKYDDIYNSYISFQNY